MVKLTLIASAFLGFFAASAFAAPSVPHAIGTKKITPVYKPNIHAGPIAGNIKYGGGPLMIGAVNIYYIYYGQWTKASDRQILENLSAHIGETSYFNIEKTYYQQLSGKGKEYVTGPVKYIKSIDDAQYSKGKSLSDQDVIDIVSTHLSSGDLVTDENGIYFLLTSPDVAVTSGLCSQYCGYHNNFKLGSKDIKFALVGDLSNCLSGCAPDNINSSPNNSPGVDGMGSVIAHEMMEAISDPDPSSGWTDASGNENADKCAYVYGTESTLSNGAKYNIDINGVKYLIQQNWNAATQGCQLGTGSGVPPPIGSSSIVHLPPPSSSIIIPSPTKTSATSKPTKTPISCHTGDDQCLSSSGTAAGYRECRNGQWVTLSCGSQGYCYQDNAVDVYCA
ncbi:phosphate-induced protein 1 conserved region-domain-containing protein [Jimgerdemannia flammicorona]|uniref:Phosphate-induced protein 1 conserved region-domain-containing protein n=1 Tax=Jimgerdemannia flammicorona TaxID=994334 RepID=A0A433DE90_9FUNG|nr:phosphate-induced protein 1 conserved region-domain-containing protein [Jimgerdemannia flammicorona]